MGEKSIDKVGKANHRVPLLLLCSFVPLCLIIPFSGYNSEADSDEPDGKSTPSRGIEPRFGT